MNRIRLISSGSWLVRRMCTLSPPAVESSRDQDRLYRKLSVLGSNGGVVQVLNQYIMEGKTVRKDELCRCVKELRKYSRYQQALEIMEWMERRKMNFSKSDYATRLDLIAKNKGVSAAEDYLSGLSPAARNLFTYGALLNCYCVELMTDKAVAHFDKMDELNLISNSLPFNNLMCLYMKLGEPEKVPTLVEQMKQRNISPCTFTYTLWMQSYASLNNIEGVEKVLEEMKNDSEEKHTWNTYANLAAIYVKAELFEKAELALKKLEEKMRPRNREPYHFLISLYASTSNAREVNRVWNSLKTALPKVNNTSYLTMLQALSKLKDVEGLRECFEAWEASCVQYDVRLANVAIRDYLKHGMYEEAANVFDNATKRSAGPFSKAREMFMVYFLKNHQVDMAQKHLEAVVSEDGSWSWSAELVSAFFDCFQEEKDVDGAEEFCRTLKKSNSLHSSAYHSLLKTYLAAGKLAPNMRQRLEADY